jgi:hypothetical protein
VCVCAYSSPPCSRRAGAYITAHDTFLFKRASFENDPPPGPALRGPATVVPSESE